MIALLGGTFDPVHRGHLAISRAALGLAGVSGVVLLPCAIPPHKARPDLTDPYRRYAMAVLAATGEERVRCSPLELRRGGVSYTIDTLEDLAARGAPEPLLLLGSDSLAEIRSWRRWEEILRRARVGVVERPGVPWERAIGSVPGELRDRIQPLPGVPDAVSSSEVRRRVAAGEEIAGLVPGPVEEFIRREGLYRGPGGPSKEDAWF